MKKLMYLPFLVLFLNTLNLFSQVSQDSKNLSRRKNLVNINLTSLAISHVGISYERVITERMSVRIYGDLSGYNYDVKDNMINMKGIGIVPEFRYYVSKKGAPKGYFLGLYAPIRRYEFDGNITDSGENYSGNGSVSYVGFGFVNGPQWLLGNRISLAIPFGFSFGVATTKGNFKYTNEEGNIENKDLDVPLVGSAFMPRFSIELGIAF